MKTAVRILAGRWKGRPLDVPRDARPTSSRAREALFDILRDAIPESRILDLFAGSGAVGLEALSRGAAEAVFVEQDSRALQANLARLGARTAEAEILQGDARDAVIGLARRGARFDLVFADPPYGLERTVASRSVSTILASGGKLVVQTDSDSEPPKVPRLAPAGRRAYGRNVFWFFEKEE